MYIIIRIGSILYIDITLQVKWSEARFNEIVQKLKIFLKQAGYKVIVELLCIHIHTIMLISPLLSGI